MTHSEELFKQAARYIPGGVNSPVRAFNGVGGVPVFLNLRKVLMSQMLMIAVM